MAKAIKLFDFTYYPPTSAEVAIREDGAIYRRHFYRIGNRRRLTAWERIDALPMDEIKPAKLTEISAMKVRLP
jgi:hypothetical protein